MKPCERCARLAYRRRYRCKVCRRLVCEHCCERIEETGLAVWCVTRTLSGVPMPKDCHEPKAA